MNLSYALNHYNHPSQQRHDLFQRVDNLALSALSDEVSLEHKPGLVCPSAMGSHDDMDYALFQKSIHSLSDYFAAICQFGYTAQPFEALKQLGIDCESKMLRATHQINTHKGAIFNLGFASAGLGRCLKQGISVTADHICEQIIEHWQSDLLNNLSRNPLSHGQQMRQKYGISGAIEQVAYGFELVREKTLPCFKAVMTKTGDAERAAMQTLMLLIAELPDTNLVWRGGMSALFIAQEMARDFLDTGGVYQAHWNQKIKNINQYFIQHRLSPGGSADLLGVSIFFYKVEHEFSDLI